MDIKKLIRHLEAPELLNDAAAGTYGVTRAAVLTAADLIKDLEVAGYVEG